MKNFTKIFILPILLLCTMITLCACGKPQDGIQINTTFKTEYYVGEKLDTTGGIIDFTKDGKTVQVVIEPSMISNFSTETAGSKKLIVTYTATEDNTKYTTTVNYIVKEIPNFPLDITGTVVYKSVKATTGGDSEAMAILFKENSVKLSPYSQNSNYEDTGFELTFYSKTFNPEKHSWEIITMATGGGFYKFTNITETSFTMETYTMENANPSEQVPPVLTDKQPIDTCQFVKDTI